MTRRRLLALVAFLAALGTSLIAGAGPAAAGFCGPDVTILKTPSGIRHQDSKGRLCTPGTAGTRSTTSTTEAPATETEALTSTTTTHADGAEAQSAPSAVVATPRYTG